MGTFFNVLSNITFFGAESEHVSNDKQILFAYGFQTFSENIISKYSSLLFVMPRWLRRQIFRNKNPPVSS